MKKRGAPSLTPSFAPHTHTRDPPSNLFLSSRFLLAASLPEVRERTMAETVLVGAWRPIADERARAKRRLSPSALVARQQTTMPSLPSSCARLRFCFPPIAHLFSPAILSILLPTGTRAERDCRIEEEEAILQKKRERVSPTILLLLLPSG